LSPDAASLADVARAFGLELLILHGSRATGHAQEASDIDIGFTRSAAPLGLRELGQLEESLRSWLPKGEIDLVDLGRAPGLLRHLACERGRLLYEDRPGRFEEFRVLAFNVYQDERIQLRRHDSEGLRVALRRLAS